MLFYFDPDFSGHVVTMNCVEKIIKKDMIDPMNGKTLTDWRYYRIATGRHWICGDKRCESKVVATGDGITMNRLLLFDTNVLDTLWVYTSTMNV